MSKMYRCGKRAPGAKRPSPRAITAHEALQLLESAVSYCQQAGLQVGATNGDNGTLAILIPNAHYVLTDSGTRAAFRLGALSAHGAGNIGTHQVSAQGERTAPGTYQNPRERHRPQM